MDINLIDLQKKLRQDGILISFSGRFSQEIIEELGGAVKKYLETEATSQNNIFNVFSIFIEQTQNIKNYSAQKKGSVLGERIANSGIVAIGKSEMGYFVSSGNLIESRDMEPLVAQLEKITVQDKTGLKKLYKEQMKREMINSSTGAGLGLIDMARKASKPLNYSIIKVDEDTHFFTLQAQV